MPIYEYECQKCGEVFEVFQKVSDPPPKSHSCGSRKVRRIMSQTSFVLKGTGWYITDYARKEKNGGQSNAPSKKRGTTSKDSSESKKSDSKSDSKGDSKGDAKGESKAA